jgi:hypothetical protein
MERLPVVKLGSDDGPFVAELIVEFKHGLFFSVAPLSFGVIWVNESDVSK